MMTIRRKPRKHGARKRPPRGRGPRRPPRRRLPIRRAIPGIRAAVSRARIRRDGASSFPVQAPAHMACRRRVEFAGDLWDVFLRANWLGACRLEAKRIRLPAEIRIGRETTGFVTGAWQTRPFPQVADG